MAVVATPPQGPVRLPRTLSDTNAPHQPLLQHGGTECWRRGASRVRPQPGKCLCQLCLCASAGGLDKPGGLAGFPAPSCISLVPGRPAGSRGGRRSDLHAPLLRAAAARVRRFLGQERGGESALACCAQPPSDVMVCVCFLFPFLPVALQGNQFGQGKHRTKSSREYARVLRQV